ncbi:hypothetical protein, variant [Capsaspora owczarzaki ATCC 30864]|nr:hypothetical protein, variant [Capsaspora owczarzaki ATCC 30864]
MLEILVTTGHKMAGELDYNTLLGLHTRGLVFLEVPVDDHDRVAVPPLEGFVMNRVTGDYFETLLYKIFVTIDEHTTIADLAAVLQTDLESVKHAVSVYCRLGFAKKKNVELDVDDVRWHLSWISRVVHRRSGSTKAETQDVQPAASTKRVAFLFDSTLTAFLMMGNLSMGLKTHAVTMFEVGKLTEESMEKFLAELDRLEGELEGDAQRYFEHAIILRDTLLFLRYNPQLAAIVDPSAAELAASGAPARPIALDLLRCESISTLDPETCFRVLNKNYHMIVSMAPFAKEVRSIRGCVPQHIGPPIPEMGSVWFKLWLYGCAGSGPPTLLLPMGARLCELPALMQPFDRVLITTWDHEPTVSSLATMLPVVNDQLCGSPVLVQAYNEQTEIAYVPFPLGPEGESGSDLPAGSSARLAAALALIQKVTALAAKRGLLPLSQHPSVLALSKHIDLAHACGYISMLKLGNSSDTSIALDAETLPDGSELPASLTHIGFFHPAHATDWVVLDLAFGIPLFDAIINAEVCRRMAVHNLFAKDALQAQMQSNRQLALELLGFINRHIAGGLLPLLDATAATLYPTQIVTYPAHLADL